MPHRLTYDFRREPEIILEQRSSAYLAIVDLDSYPAFAAENSDRLDLLQHLSLQMQALTATMWETPDDMLRLRLVLARDYRVVEDLQRSHHHVFADGWVRSGGRLCLAGHDRLLTSARRRERGLLRFRRATDGRSPRTLLVPPGMYAVTVFAGLPEKDAFDYTVVLRHYPFPPPRLQPVRLGGFLPSPA